MAVQQALAFPALAGSETIIINARCSLRREAAYRAIVVAGLTVHQYNAVDAVAEAYAMVFLVDGGFAQQKEVARAFACSERTVRRHQRRYAEGGMTALATRSGWRSGRRRVRTRRLRTIESLKAEGLSNRAIARRVGVTENAIRQIVGPTKDRAKQEVLPLPELLHSAPDDDAVQEEAVSAPNVDISTTEQAVPMNLDSDPENRILDRLLACAGLLDDAAPMFRPGLGIPGAGVLVAVPLFVQSGVFRISSKLYGEIGPAFYGLRTTLITLLLMALLRIKRPEALKEHDPETFGRLLGLDRSPEVKTLRRKLARLASCQRAVQLGAELARSRVEQRGHMLGFLYVDGHVRAYHGKRTIPKTHLARMRISMPATTDYWVGDQAGDPLFVMTAQANAGMTKMLPTILAEVRKLVGDRRVTIVFDRGGWSPKLFQKLLEDNFDILTYRKGRCRKINNNRFQLRRATFDGHAVEYRLHDQPVRFLKGKLRLRQVVRLTDTGHQTQIITSRWDLDDIEVAYRMFERWRQENFFKYMREEFLIDALTDHQVEPDDPTRSVPNPKRRPFDKKIRAQKAVVAKLEQEYGAAAVENSESQRPTMRGFKIAHSKLGTKLRQAKEELGRLLKKRRALPSRVEIQDVSDDAVIKLATEKKHLTNIIKMLAYQVESDLLALLQSHYARSDDEGRTLLHEIFNAAADIKLENHELQIILRPLSSPHRTKAAQAMCEALDKTGICFPGTDLRLRYAIYPTPIRGLAFPGPVTRKKPP